MEEVLIVMEFIRFHPGNSRPTRIAIDGTLERWVYFKDQLPSAVHTSSVEFRFITQAGYWDHVMQKDFWPMKAMADARKTTVLQPE